MQARYIIVGSVGSIGDRFLLNMRFIDVETGETLTTSSQKYNSINDMIDDSESVAISLLDTSGDVKSVDAGTQEKRQC